jgi:hypothetical protein
VPEPFRSTLTGALKDRERTQKLLYSPSVSTIGFNAPATLLAITDDRWLVILDEGTKSSHALHATFDDTLLVELTVILLSGQLKLDFVKEGALASIAVQFDSVSKSYYFEAVESLLAGMEVRPISQAFQTSEPTQGIKDWPLKFQSIVSAYLPKGRRLHSGIYWETIYGGFDREIAPAGALVRTEQELVLVAEEKAPEWRSRQEGQDKYGEIITYFPLRSQANYRIIDQHRVDILSLEVHARHRGEKLEVTIPKGRREEVEALMEISHEGKAKALASTELGTGEREDP